MASATIFQTKPKQIHGYKAIKKEVMTKNDPWVSTKQEADTKEQLAHSPPHPPEKQGCDFHVLNDG